MARADGCDKAQGDSDRHRYHCCRHFGPIVDRDKASDGNKWRRAMTRVETVNFVCYVDGRNGA